MVYLTKKLKDNSVKPGYMLLKISIKVLFEVLRLCTHGGLNISHLLDINQICMLSVVYHLKQKMRNCRQPPGAILFIFLDFGMKTNFQRILHIGLSDNVSNNEKKEQLNLSNKLYSAMFVFICDKN